VTEFKPNNPWLAFDERDDYENYLSGNRAGLELLRTAIDGALEKGQTSLEGQWLQIAGVVLVENDPREVYQRKPKTPLEHLYTLGCLVMLVLVVATLFLGARQIWALLQKLF
jgi:hypothetical protein